ncbi:ATP-binding protein [Bacteroides graminisolvens]
MAKFSINKQYLLSLALVFLLVFPASAVLAAARPNILIINSYNADAQGTSNNISEFMDEYRRLGGTENVVIENMNCQSFQESPKWKGRMQAILDKYIHSLRPRLLVLVGQEAFISYQSQENPLLKDIPVICGMVSRRIIDLPVDSARAANWQPRSIDVSEGKVRYPICGGYLYNYDVDANIALIKKLYPQTKNIAFLSDNSYGGVALQAYVRQEMTKYEDLRLIQLDGRHHTLYTIVDELRSLPPHTVLLIGAWKIDEKGEFFMRNASYVMMDANPELPVFTLSNAGFGSWALGGVMPTYFIFGRSLAREAVEVLEKPKNYDMKANFVENQMMFDYIRVNDRKLSLNVLNGNDYRFINKPLTLYEQYKYHLWAFVAFLLFLVIGFISSLWFFLRTKKLKDSLEVSEQELRVAKEAAEEASRLKSSFLANISHEIRTPLNAIVGFSEVLLGGGYTPEEQKQYMSIIQRNSDLLLKLINDIIEVSTLESENVEFKYQECDVVEFCKQLLLSLNFADSSENHFRFASSLESYVAKVEVQYLQQVILNLLSNADKFTKQGTITLEVSVNESFIEFAVADTGCGIPQEKQQVVFERFIKLNDFAQGTGLGLSICKLIIQKWGGEIWVDPAYSKGARFVFTHPIVK